MLSRAVTILGRVGLVYDLDVLRGPCDVGLISEWVLGIEVWRRGGRGRGQVGGGEGAMARKGYAKSLVLTLMSVVEPAPVLTNGPTLSDLVAVLLWVVSMGERWLSTSNVLSHVMTPGELSLIHI